MAKKRPENRKIRQTKGPKAPPAVAQPAPKPPAPSVPRKGDGTFPKGVSGNPGGRPAEFTDFVKLAREMGSPMAFRTLKRKMRHGDDRAAVQAALGMLAYAWGKPKQAVELSGPGGGPVKTETTDPGVKLPFLTKEELAQLKELALRAVERAEKMATGGDGGSSGRPAR